MKNIINNVRGLVVGYQMGREMARQLLGNEEYMAESLKGYPFLSDEERLEMAQQFAEAYRTKGFLAANIATWKPQARCIVGVADALLRKAPAWRPPTARAIALVHQTLGNPAIAISIDYN